jgi:hypothetical protein
MPPFTLGQAAKATGRSKAGLLDAIRSGRISAGRDDKNQWQIDPAELHRVYPLIVQPDVKTEQEQTLLNPPDLTHFQEKTAFLERIISGLENERDDLRRRLDAEAVAREKAADDVRRLTLLLTDQRPPAPTQIEPEPAPPPVRPFLWFTLAAAALGAVWWYAWPWWGNRQ